MPIKKYNLKSTLKPIAVNRPGQPVLSKAPTTIGGHIGRGLLGSVGTPALPVRRY